MAKVARAEDAVRVEVSHSIPLTANQKRTKFESRMMLIYAFSLFRLPIFVLLVKFLAVKEKKNCENDFVKMTP